MNYKNVLILGFAFVVVTSLAVYKVVDLTFEFSAPQAAELDDRLAQLQAQREVNWASTYNGWEVFYDGRDTPADNVLNHLQWDSPLDGDWNEPRVVAQSYSLNNPSLGFLTIDRATNPEDRHKNGNIWRRDEFLSLATGITIEARIKILPQSEQDAIFISHTYDTGSFAVFLSPNQVKIGPITRQPMPPDYGTVSTPFVAGNGFHTYRVVKQPFSENVALYIDGTLVLTGVAFNGYKVGSVPYVDFPNILLGDNIGTPNLNAAFVLDYVGYRRGAFPPGSQLTAISKRIPPPLPTSTENQTLVNGYEGTVHPEAIPGSQGGVSGTYSLVNDSSATDGKALKLDTHEWAEDMVYFINPPGLIDRGPYTAEIRVKVLPGSEENGFVLNLLDQRGSISIILSPNSVSLGLGLQPRGKTTIPFNTTDGYHTYRVVRPPNQLYAYLYIDNDPIPKIFDQHIDGTTVDFVRVGFGRLKTANGWRPGITRALIDYIRWSNQAFAPNSVTTSAPRVTLTVPTQVQQGSPVRVQWQFLQNPSTRLDWIGIVPKGSSWNAVTNGARNWIYWNGSTSKPSATAPAQGEVFLPISVPPGQYDILYYTNDGVQEKDILGRSTTLTVTAQSVPSPTPTLIPSPSPLPSASPNIPGPIVRLLCSSGTTLSFTTNNCVNTAGILEWSIQGSATCVASESPATSPSKWNGPKQFSLYKTGRETVEDLTLTGKPSTRTYLLTCTNNAGGTTQATATVTRPSITTSSNQVDLTVSPPLKSFGQVQVDWKFNSGTSSAKDWIAVVPKNTTWASSSKLPRAWVYLNGNTGAPASPLGTAGSTRISLPGSPGDYQVLFYRNDSVQDADIIGRSPVLKTP